MTHEEKLQETLEYIAQKKAEREERERAQRRAATKRWAATPQGREWLAKNQRERYYSKDGKIRSAEYRARFSVEQHLKSLCRYPGREQLAPTALVAMFHKQDGRCNVSGVKMTWGQGRGQARTPTNISIDRIVPGGPYTIENVQLVCNVVNSMKSNLLQDELVRWCQLIVDQARTQQQQPANSDRRCRTLRPARQTHRLDGAGEPADYL